jgi:hypothetical protein
VVGSSSSAHTAILHTTDHGTTWTSVSLGGVTVPQWLVGQSVPGAGLIMAVPSVTVGVGLTYFTSPDGTTWTSQLGLTGLPLLSTETPTTLCYGTDATGIGCWILTTVESVSSLTKTYRSYDGVSWGAFANSLPTGVILARMAAVGQQLVGVVFENSLSRVVYSLDGGSTWYTTNVEALWTTSLNLAASNNQFFLQTDVAFNVSRRYGNPAGLGAR